MSIISLIVLIQIVFFIVHEKYLYILLFIALSLILQLFSKNEIVFLLFPIILVYLLYKNNQREGFLFKKAKKAVSKSSKSVAKVASNHSKPVANVASNQSKPIVKVASNQSKLAAKVAVNQSKLVSKRAQQYSRAAISEAKNAATKAWKTTRDGFNDNITKRFNILDGLLDMMKGNDDDDDDETYDNMPQTTDVPEETYIEHQELDFDDTPMEISDGKYFGVD